MSDRCGRGFGLCAVATGVCGVDLRYTFCYDISMDAKWNVL